MKVRCPVTFSMCWRVACRYGCGERVRAVPLRELEGSGKGRKRSDSWPTEIAVSPATHRSLTRDTKKGAGR